MKRYLSLILLLALMLGIFGVSYAQTTVTIGDGTAYTYEPFNVLWGYCRSIGLYTFDQIGQPGQITSLGWNVGSTGTASVPYKIYAKLTTDPAQTAGTWADFVATATLLKQGTYIFNTSGWHTFTFDTPFAFSGGNLLIGVEATFGGTGASGCPQFCYTAGAAGIHQYWRQDSSAPTGNGTLNTILPNLQMTMMPLSDDPYLSLRPSGYDFGRVVINTTNSKTFTITNAGGGTLNVTGISPLSSGFFTLTDVPAWPVALTSGQSTTFNIQYAPTAVGNHDATFTITDGRATTNLTVSGECFDPVIYDFPWLEEFTDTTFPPLDWSRYVGLYPADALTPIDFKWVRTNFANVGNPANPSARINIWGDATKHWLVTPPIAIPATGYQLDFNLALTKYSNSNPVDPTLQQDDKFIVFIADNQTMVNPTILREWNNADSPYVYNNITTLGEYQVIDLSAHVGTKYIAFYGESTASGGDNDLFVDNVRVRESPTTPILTYTPDALNFGTGFANTPMAYRNVTVSNTGGGTLDLPIANVSIVGEDAAMFEFDPVNLPFALTVGQGGIIPVRYNPTAAGTHSATLRMVYAGENYDVALSGRALSESALFESFESTIYPPAGWQTTWTRNTSYAVHGGASAYRYGSTTAQHLLSTPMLTIVDDSTLDFWIRCGSTNGVIEVLYSPDRENWTQIGENITFAVGGTWYNHVIDLSSLAGNNYYLALRTGLIGTGYYADMFIGPDITPLVPGTPVLASPADAATNVVTTPTFTWTAPATGGVPTSYNIYCDTNETPTTLVGTSTTLSFTLDTPLSYSTTYYWTVTAENAEGESVPATPRSFTTIADPTVYTYPFVEGFEVGQTQGALVLGWLNYRDDNKSRDWLINSTNTTYNRTPRNGSYNATLMWNGNAWLMKPFSVEAGQSYDVEVWARQDGSTAANASVGLYYGTEGTIAGMTNTILTQTGIVNGDYQSLFGSFTPTADGICWIAIHGVINNSPYYISIDDILVQPTPTGPVFAYTPDTIDFGSVFYNTASAPVDVTVTNIGVGSLSLDASDISIVGPNAADFAFAATNLPASLAPNESVTIPVTVNSTTEGPISATLRMVYDATNYDVALSANVYSQSVLTIGDGTSYNNTSTYPAVYGAWYKNAREQYILTAAELNAAGAQAGIINTIGFNVHTPNSAANLPNFKISMGTTTASEFTDTTFLTGLAEVYSVATYTPVAGWNAHNLDTPFYWDGTSNIVIQTSFGMLASYSNNASTYYTSTEPAYRAMFYRNDSTAWDTVTTATDRSYNRPNMLLDIGALPSGPPAAPILSSPADNATDLYKYGFDLAWSPDVMGGGLPTNYGVFLATDPAEIYDQGYWETTNTCFNPVTEGGMDLAYGQRYYWTVQAINDDGDAVADPPFSFIIESDPTIYAYPWTENFDALSNFQMPEHWTVFASHTGDDDRGWIAYNHANILATSAPNSAVVFFHPNFVKDEWMITLPFSMQAGVEYNLSFQLRAPGNNNGPEAMSVHWGAEPTIAAMTVNPALFDESDMRYPDWTFINLRFIPTTTGTYFFGWHAKTPLITNYIAVDDITIELAQTIDLAATALGGDVIGNVGFAVNQNVTVVNMGTEAQSNYTVYIKEAVTNNVLGQELITDSIAPNEVKVHTLSWTPSAVGPVSVYAEVALASDLVASNNVTDEVIVTIYAANEKLLYLGDPNSSWVTSGYPWALYYKDGVAESIYLASEIQAQNGTIQAVAYYNNFLGGAMTIPVQIWMKNTDAANVSTGWLPWDGYQLVFDGNINCPNGINEIMIQLDTPFAYTGQNLAIRTSKTWENSYVSNQRWRVTPNELLYPGRTRYYYADSTGELDHTAPPAGTLSNYVPNIVLVTASDAFVYTVATPEPTMTADTAGPVLSWEAVPYAYSYNIYATADPYNFEATPTATVYTNSVPIDATEAAKGFYKVTANTYRDYNRASGILRNPVLTDVIEVDVNPIEKAKSKARGLTP